MEREIIELKLVPDEANKSYEALKEQFIKEELDCHEVIPIPAPREDDLCVWRVPIFNLAAVDKYWEILGQYEDGLIMTDEELPEDYPDELPLVKVDGMVYEPAFLYEARLALEEYKAED